MSDLKGLTEKEVEESRKTNGSNCPYADSAGISLEKDYGRVQGTDDHDPFGGTGCGNRHVFHGGSRLV